ncbi:MAG: hypothetical protein ABIJ17_01075 [Patescibacteria group bacterium]
MSNQSMHWREKYEWCKAWKEEVYGQVMIIRNKLGKLPLLNPKITIVFHVVRQFDLDGAYNAAKPILDGLKVDWAGLIVDDSPKYIELSVKQTKVDHKVEERVEIIIYPPTNRE